LLKVEDTTQFKDMPKLEEKLPEKYFPDILLVNDPNSVTLAREGYRSPKSPSDQNETTPTPRKYRRVYPKLERDTIPALSSDITPQMAYLNLARAPLLGTGHHSLVHRASLRLPPPLAANSPTGEVTVAAKVAFQEWSARELLDNEAKIYDAFPEHLMENWCGLNLVAPIKEPVPVGAVVPRFYGYYLPVKEDDDNVKEKSESDDVRSNDQNRSPILLLEECGSPIEPGSFSQDERSVSTIFCAKFPLVICNLITTCLMKQDGMLLSTASFALRAFHPELFLRP
jgi:hypothetical protein